MKLKRMSIRFNLEDETDRKAWGYLQSTYTSMNKAVIVAINACFEPVNVVIVDTIRQTIQECLQNISAMAAPTEEAHPAVSEEENELLDSLDDFLGG
ncbi:MAG TPA: hypothetical protein VFD52_04230 [Clostridia bacterium]|nr:hypothetical protein [Clostridia bacterium]